MTFFSQVFKLSLYCNHATVIMRKKRIKIYNTWVFRVPPSRSDLPRGWAAECMARSQTKGLVQAVTLTVEPRVNKQQARGPRTTNHGPQLTSRQQ